MWRFVFIFIFVLSLAGCSVTIDQKNSEPKDNELNQEEQQLDDTKVTESTIEQESEQYQDSNGFVDLLENVFNIDWSTRVDVEARDVKYLALGDSLTRGIGDETKEFGYTIRLQKELEKWSAVKEVELDNRGKNGRRSDQLLALLQKGHYDEEIAGADLITVTLGGNDVMKVVKKNIFKLQKTMFDKEVPKFTANYEEIMAEIRMRNPEVPIILVGFYNPFSIIVDEITPFEPIVREWNTTIEDLAKQDENACFVSIEDLFTSNEDMVYHVDFFHPNSAGYDRMTRRIIETMQQCNIKQMSDGLFGFEEWENE
ncbi:lysophospholipase [Solibacillus sp. R5-41]|uniref:GDSL-type esterase/lipase family protein n=1 Tax=Solibacillus sp. R5-41 TaxID=2048654 RepID=UPI000C125DAF|nr:GDSL-type esterase/lipase family protein [Solibacillus sp. R5-41]ATP40097.1 lysophospholipase [Solibacillus sp. R5-41]